MCIVSGCEKPVLWRGMCAAHYQQWRREARPGGHGHHPIKRHAALVSLFGGTRAFCRAVGIDPKTLHRWPEGEIPHERWADIADGATRAGVDAEAVRAVLGGGNAAV